MTRIITHILLTSASTLVFTASAFATPAPQGKMTLLPDIPAEQIARDVSQSFDSQTGIQTLTAQTFDPFEQDSTLAGTAALRLGPSAVPLNGNGTPTSGGAFLDLTMVYTRPSNDPYDIRGFDRAVYVSGAPVSRIRQDIRTLDCASNTTEVIYEDNYYDHYSPYGLLAGIYLALPRYRGHRGYWSGQSYRRPHRGWSQWRKRARSAGYGYDYGLGYDHFGDGRSDRRRGDRRRGGGRAGRGDEDRASGGAGRGGTSPRRGDAGRTPPHSGENIRLGGSGAHREYVDRRGVRTGDREDRIRGAGDRAERARTSRERASRDGTRGGQRDGRGARRSGTITARPPGPASGTSVGPAPVPIARQPAPRPIARTAPPTPVAPISRPAPITRPAPNRVERRRETRPERRSERSRESRRDTRRSDRGANRSVKRNSRSSPRRQRNFFPALGGYQRSQNSYSTVQTDYRCVREESVTLHIPQDRLDAARFDGLTLVLVDNADRDVAVYIPPNYIEGFRLAAKRSRGASYQTPHQLPPATYPQD